MQVNLENNKYTLTFDETTGDLIANRNGEYWLDYTGNKLMYSLLARIVELESELEDILSDEDEAPPCSICGHNGGTSCGLSDCGYGK